MKIGNKLHLSYCTNIHPGQDWPTTFNSLQAYVPQIKSQLSPNAPFGLGLRLSNQASIELSINGQLDEFRNWLSDQNCYIFTMNGFPYGNFHGEVIKDKVHLPDWTERERLEYTQRLFGQLAYLLPTESEGGISTSPISYKPWFSKAEQRTEVMEKACGHLISLALFLQKQVKQQETISISILNPNLTDFWRTPQMFWSFIKTTFYFLEPLLLQNAWAFQKTGPRR